MLGLSLQSSPRRLSTTMLLNGTAVRFRLSTAGAIARRNDSIQGPLVWRISSTA
jgi:hypothetical protein